MQSDPDNETSPFVWITSERPVTRSWWCPGQPSDHQRREDYAEFVFDSNNMRLCLNDDWENVQRPCVCEHEVRGL